MHNPHEDETVRNPQVVGEIVTRHDGPHDLISILLEIQEKLGWLSRESMLEAAHLLQISETTVYSVATFYNRFRFTPPGKFNVHVCMGTACHVRRGGVILDLWKRRLEISEGETTSDREYSLDRVDCVGCCAMAPVTVVNDDVLGKMTTAAVDGVLLKHEMERETDRKKAAAKEAGRKTTE